MSLGICLKVTPLQSQQIIFQQNLGRDIAPAHCIVQGTRGECCPVFGDAELRLFECCVNKQVSSHYEMFVEGSSQNNTGFVDTAEGIDASEGKLVIELGLSVLLKVNSRISPYLRQARRAGK